MPPNFEEVEGANLFLGLFFCPSIYPSPNPTHPAQPCPPPPPPQKKKKKKNNALMNCYAPFEEFEGANRLGLFVCPSIYPPPSPAPLPAPLQKNWSCQGHNSYINALLWPQLRRSWRGILVWPVRLSIHLPPPPPQLLPPKKYFFFSFFF